MEPTILTDADGRPLERPRREAFESDADFARAFHEWRDRIADAANAWFDEGFRRAMGGRR